MSSKLLVRLFIAGDNACNGPRSTETIGHIAVIPRIWHIADLVCDIDTLAAFLDEQTCSIHGFGTENGVDLKVDFTASLLLGRGLVANSGFNGQLAAFLLGNKISVALETLLRSTPQWFITMKLDSLQHKLNMATTRP